MWVILPARIAVRVVHVACGSPDGAPCGDGSEAVADNVEPPLWNILRDPDNMIRYTWRSYPHVGELLAEARGKFASAEAFY